ncbi:MAG: GNAT family N-acetyltransferase [Streptococcus sp.]|nr:GNAT family N-acetyltransferase [Streptococcus sp.]
MVFSIRKAELSDLSSIQKICIDTWKETYKTIYSTEYMSRVFSIFYSDERLKKDITKISAEWNGYWVAVENNQILGCIGGGIDEAGNANVYVLYVSPDAQGRGVGHALLEALTAYQKQAFHSIKQLVSVTEGNQIGISFYERQGFTLFEAVTNWVDASQVRDLHYIREI